MRRFRNLRVGWTLKFPERRITNNYILFIVHRSNTTDGQLQDNVGGHVWLQLRGRPGRWQYLQQFDELHRCLSTAWFPVRG